MATMEEVVMRMGASVQQQVLCLTLSVMELFRIVGHRVSLTQIVPTLDCVVLMDVPIPASMDESQKVMEPLL